MAKEVASTAWPVASLLLLVLCADLADGEDSPDCAPESALSLARKTAGEDRSQLLALGTAWLARAGALGTL